MHNLILLVLHVDCFERTSVKSPYCHQCGSHSAVSVTLTRTMKYMYHISNMVFLINLKYTCSPVSISCRCI